MRAARLLWAQVMVFGAALIAPNAFAACATPAGVAGDQIYNSTYSVMQFCNGTNWVNMGGVSSTSTAVGSTGMIQFNTTNNLDAEAALTWDKTNDRLGIGTAVPGYALDVIGTASVSGAVTLGGTLIGVTGVGIGTSSVSSKAVLDVVSTTKGFLPPRMTTTQRDAITSPPTGLVVFNTTTNALNYFNGTAWQDAASNFVETDPQVGTLTASNFCLSNAGGTAIDCTTAAIAISSISATGTPSSSTYLRGDGAWSIISALSGGSTGYGAVWSSATALTYDTALYVDANNHRVGIGTASPSTVLDVNGAATLRSTLAVTGAITLSSTLAGVTGIGVGTSSIASTAVLDIVSTTKGILPPRMTTTQRDAISSPATGLIVYNTTTNTVDVYTGLAWTSVGSSAAGVPTGAIAAFASGSCPSGWTAFSAAAGRFMVGTGTLGGNTYNATDTGGEATHTLTVAELPSHTHAVDPPATATTTDGAHSHTYTTPLAYDDVIGGSGTSARIATTGTTSTAGNHSHNVDIPPFTSGATGSGAAHENRPPYLAVVYCQYNGGGGGGVGVNALASLSDVGISSPTNGQALIYNSGSNTWVNGTAGSSLSGGSAGYAAVWSSSSALTYDSSLAVDTTNHAVGIGTTSPSTKAVLDMVSTTKGFLPPRMTTTNRDAISSPATGLTIYNTTTNALNVYNGSAWGAVGGGALSTLTDVTLSSPANNDVLRYNGSAWVNVAASTAMTTTTMVANWPDEIVCTATNGDRWYYVPVATTTGTGSGEMYYGMAQWPGTRYMVFNSNGSWNTEASGTSNCSSKSITQLYATGQAFNFIGTGAVTTFNVGTASAPGLAVTSDTDTGIWSAGANTFNISTGGSERVRIDSSGNVGIGTASPNANLHVKGAASAYSLLNIESSGGAGNGYGARLDLTNTNGATGELRMADSGSGTTYSAQASYLTMSAPSSYGIKINTNGTDNSGLRIDTSGNVGIGSTSPGAKLDVSGDTRSSNSLATMTGRFEGNTGPAYFTSGSTGVEIGDTGTFSFIQTGVRPSFSYGSHPLDIIAGGGVGIGTASPQAPLHVWGRERSQVSRGYIQLNEYYVGSPYLEYATSDGYWGVTMWASSRNFKDNIKDLDFDSSKIYQLRPVSFRWKKNRGGGTDFGLIAEEVEKLFPLLLLRDKEGKAFSVRYDLISVLLLPEIKKLKAMFDSDHAELLKLRAANDNIAALRREFEAYKAAHP